MVTVKALRDPQMPQAQQPLVQASVWAKSLQSNA
jgi:hypothetical protein